MNKNTNDLWIYIPVGFDSMIDLNAVLGHGFIFGLIILYSGSPRYIFAGIWKDIAIISSFVTKLYKINWMNVFYGMF